jgi:tRNA-specific 2-thiouridylase
MKKILVAMSGGVDSTVVAHKLQSLGYEIQGVYMKLHHSESYHEENIKKVSSVCAHLGIEYHVLDLHSRFDERVFYPFIETYKRGLTPNPCVVCNKNIKFGALIDFAKEKGFDALATGHYAKVVDGLFAEAKDKAKDQSYFLAQVDPSLCAFILFPLGDMLKDEVKEYAKSIDFLQQFAKQKESSEICFVEDSYIDLLKEFVSVDQEGIVVDSKGKDIGSHKGYMHYTIGKRKGFNVRIAHDPHYVKRIDAKNNIVEVGLKEELKVEQFVLSDFVNYIGEMAFEATVKIRYRSHKTPCFVKVEQTKALVTLHAPVYGLAPGQYAVFYQDDRVVASGIIVK